jgi:hypothetical protein
LGHELLEERHLLLNVRHIVIGSVEVDDLESHDLGCGDVTTFVDGAVCSFAYDLEFLGSRVKPVGGGQSTGMAFALRHLGQSTDLEQPLRWDLLGLAYRLQERLLSRRIS